MDSDLWQRLLNQPIAPLSHVLPRVPLKLKPSQENLTPARKRLQNDILSEVERECFAYESFDLQLPESIAAVSEAPSIAITGLFPEQWNERGHGGRDVEEGHNGRTLSSEQLRDAAQKGEFSVDSSFPGLPHVWKVTKLVQEGRLVSGEKCKSRLAWSLEQLFVYFPDRLFHEKALSVPASLRSLWKGLWGLLDIFLGVPDYQHGPVEPSLFDVFNTMVLEDPKRFLTGVNNLELLWKALPIAESIAKGVVDGMAAEEMPGPSQGVDAFFEPGPGSPPALNASESLFLSKLKSDERLRVVSPTIGNELSDLFLALMVAEKVVFSVKQGLEHDEESERERLVKDHPILGKSEAWVEKKIKAWRKKRTRSRGDQDMWVAFDQITEWLSRDSSTGRELQLVEKCRYFLANRKQTTKNSNQVLSSAEFRIWLPKNWEIESTRGRYFANKRRSKEFKAGFGWRWISFIWTAASFMNNGLFFLIAVVMHISLRGLISYDEFYPDTEVNSRTGELETKMSVRFPSLISRTRRLWQSARESRASFEREGDSGLLPKSSTRWLNWLWNYGVKFFAGTLLVWIVQPILTLLSLAISLALVVTSPAWAVAGAFLLYLFRILFFDYNSTPFRFFALLIVNILTFGIGQFIGAVLGAVCHLLAMLLGVVFSPLAFAMRRIWDGLMFHILLKNRARIPSHDTFIARRIAGPGLANDVFYQLDPSIALLTLFAHLETIELEWISKSVLTALEEAPEQFQQLHDQIIGPVFGSDMEASKAVPQFRHTAWKEQLSSEVRKGKHQLGRFLVWNKDSAWRIRFSAADLNEVLAAGVILVEAFYSRRIIPRMSEPDGSRVMNSLQIFQCIIDILLVFQGASVDVGDWMGLTKHVLGQMYHNDILEPIESAEKKLRLEISHVGLRSFGRMLIDGLPRDDLDEAKPVMLEIQPETQAAPSVNPILPRVHAVNRTHFGEDGADIEFPLVLDTALQIPFLDFCSTRPSEFGAESLTLRGVLMKRTVKMDFLELEVNALKLVLHETGKLKVVSWRSEFWGYYTASEKDVALLRPEGVRLVWKMALSRREICVEGTIIRGNDFWGKWESIDGKDWGTMEAFVDLPVS
ncbi:hypothetical protein BSKO_03365 [Bryopsis sp. KO-2023]|nr:hypothetical protein BSKO_03365 [Bryopsis sp. KO-2023]